jgi:hypothetical protein
MSSFLDWGFTKWFKMFESKKRVSKRGGKFVVPVFFVKRPKGNHTRFRQLCKN